MAIEEQEQQKIKQKGYMEAMRYIACAKAYLSNSGMDGKFYMDAKNLHLGGYYDGNEDSTVIKSGFESTKEIIDLIKPCVEAP